jgi:hypothetical protein
VKKRWSSGTGRKLDWITIVARPRISESHAPSSSAFGIVADRHTKRTSLGAKIKDSSHTDPRSTSSMKWTSSNTTYSTGSSVRGFSKIELRRISVVITRTCAPGWIVTSPVISPTSMPSALKSRYFWFDSALIGAV